jgi:O-antigen ligase
MSVLAPTATTTREVALTTARVAAIVALIGTVLSPPLANVAAVVLVFAFLSMPDAFERLRRVLAAPLGRAVLVFVAVLLWALGYGLVTGLTVPGAALMKFVDWRHLLLLLAALALFDDPRWKLRLALSFVVFACLAAVVTLITWKLGVAYKEFPPGVLLRNTVTQALTFACGAFLAALLALTGLVQSRRARVALLVAAAGLTLHLVFLGYGRSGHVTLVIVAAVAVLMLLRGWQRTVALLAVPLLATGAYVASPQMQQRFEMGLAEVQDTSAQPPMTSMGLRMVIWDTTSDLIRARPLLGYGLGGFTPAYAERIQQKNYTDWRAEPKEDPHNQYAFLLIEGGVPLLLAFVWLMVAAFREAERGPYRTAGLALLVAWSATGMVSSHFQTFSEGHLIMLFVGAFLARTRDAQAAGAGANISSTASATSA